MCFFSSLLLEHALVVRIVMRVVVSGCVFLLSRSRLGADFDTTHIELALVEIEQQPNIESKRTKHCSQSVKKKKKKNYNRLPNE
jgi:hypothetical protein